MLISLGTLLLNRLGQQSANPLTSDCHLFNPQAPHLSLFIVSGLPGPPCSGTFRAHCSLSLDLKTDPALNQCRFPDKAAVSERGNVNRAKMEKVYF